MGVPVKIVSTVGDRTSDKTDVLFGMIAYILYNQNRRDIPAISNNRLWGVTINGSGRKVSFLTNIKANIQALLSMLQGWRPLRLA